MMKSNWRMLERCCRRSVFADTKFPQAISIFTPLRSYQRKRGESLTKDLALSEFRQLLPRLFLLLLIQLRFREVLLRNLSHLSVHAKYANQTAFKTEERCALFQQIFGRAVFVWNCGISEFEMENTWIAPRFSWTSTNLLPRKQKTRDYAWRSESRYASMHWTPTESRKPATWSRQKI